MTCPSASVGEIGARQDLKVRQGGTFLVYLNLKAGGTAVDLTGCTVRAQARKRPSDESPSFTFTCEIVGLAAAGRVSLGLTAVETAAIVCGPAMSDQASQYQWDFELVDATGAVVPLLWGTVFVHREITRA